MAYGIQDPIDMARLLKNMSFGGLMEVARDLVDMNKEGERDIKTDLGMASTLYDWADATVERANELAEQERQAREAAQKAAA